jgi:hypothetical protein
VQPILLQSVTGLQVQLLLVKLNVQADADANNSTWVGVGVGVVDPEEPELMVFDEVTVHELPHSCCVSWLFPLFENILVNLLL